MASELDVERFSPDTDCIGFKTVFSDCVSTFIENSRRYLLESYRQLDVLLVKGKPKTLQAVLGGLLQLHQMLEYLQGELDSFTSEARSAMLNNYPQSKEIK